jgi:hypothetical protein
MDTLAIGKYFLLSRRIRDLHPKVNTHAWRTKRNAIVWTKAFLNWIDKLKNLGKKNKKFAWRSN